MLSLYEARFCYVWCVTQEVRAGQGFKGWFRLGPGLHQELCGADLRTLSGRREATPCLRHSRFKLVL